jgi:Raf kinase inhibitor-like YbhB/YbcL family protein
MCGRRRLVRWLPGAAAIALAACSAAPAGSRAAEGLAARPVDATIAVASPSFADGAPIPRQFTCDGGDTSPPLSWRGVPAGAVELAVVVDDPDARGGTYVHWILFGLDPSLSELQQGTVPAASRQADNSAGEPRYKGPCPPGGHPHHYRFTVYALVTPVAAPAGAPPGDALGRVGAAAIAKGALIATYQR